MVKAIFYTVKDVETLFSVSRQTLYNWRTAKPDFPLPASDTNGKVRYFRDEIDAYIARQRLRASRPCAVPLGREAA